MKIEQYFIYTSEIWAILTPFDCVINNCIERSDKITHDNSATFLNEWTQETTRMC